MDTTTDNKLRYSRVSYCTDIAKTLLNLEEVSDAWLVSQLNHLASGYIKSPIFGDYVAGKLLEEAALRINGLRKAKENQDLEQRSP